MGGMEEVAKVAIHCNSKIPKSAVSERNWSLFGGMLCSVHIILQLQAATCVRVFF